MIEDLKRVWGSQPSALSRLILINVFVFLFISVLHVLLTLAGGKGVYQVILSYLRLSPDVGVFISRPWTLITYFFLHEGFFHILFNLLFFFWFGRIVLDFLGSDRVIHLYLLGGVAAGLFFMIAYNHVPYYAEDLQITRLQGSSGSVYAVVAGAATLAPNYEFRLFLIGSVKIKYIAIFCLVLSFFRIVGTNAGGELAHLGGGLMGYLYISQLQKGNDWGKPIAWILSLFNPKPNKPKPRHKKPKSKNSGSKEADIDKILDKISKSGYGSLSAQEKDLLFRESSKGKKN
ncbi:MAG: rhomboid family intramembrane serine protease [Cytophagales bacterium]|nr:rhomboid family intramembrane serine protease [Cytophagales bacterium]